MPPTPAAQVQGESQTSELPATASLSDAARILAERRNALRPQKASIDQQGVDLQTDQGEIEDLSEDLVDDGTQQLESEEGALDSDTQSDDDQPEGDNAVFLLDGEEIPVSDVKAWREGAMRTEDYQRKTQVVSQQQAQLTKMEEDLNQFAHGINRMFQAQMAPVQQVLKRYETTDWSELAKDPVKFQAEQVKHSAAKNRFEQIQREWGAYLQEYQALSKRQLQARAQAALPEIKQRVKGWNDGMYAEHSDFVVKKYGASQELVNKITDPWFWEMVHDAMNFRKGQQLPGLARKIARRSPSATPRGGTAPAQRSAPAAQREATARKNIEGSMSTLTQTENAVEILRARREANQLPAGQRRRV